MNRKQFVLLLVLVVVIGGTGLAVQLYRASRWEGRVSNDSRVVRNFDLNQVAEIVIKAGDATATIAKKDDLWVVRDRDDYPADFSRVGGFIQTLWQLKPVQEVGKVGSSKLPQLDLVTPAKDAAHGGTLVELRDKDSKPLTALLIGKKYMKKSPRFPDEEGVPMGRYVMPADGKGPVSLVSERLEQAEVHPAAWLEKTLPRMDALESVTVSSGSSTLKFFRENASASEWKLDGLQPQEQLDKAKIPSFASMFSAPKLADVKPSKTSREGLNSTVVVTTFDGFTFTLRFGNAEGDKLPLAISTVAEFPKERTAGKDEKPEDKKRLDDQFAAKTKQLEDMLAKAKSCEARVYLVAKGTFEPLWKPREEYLVKPEPAPSATPAATAPNTK